MSNFPNDSEADKPKILIVDDERMAREILEGHLASENYELIFASNGFQALEALEKGPVDLVLLDVMMRHMDGIQVCQRIKTNEQWQHILVILITGFTDQELESRGKEAGADGFVEKPIKGTVLREMIRSMLSNRST